MKVTLAGHNVDRRVLDFAEERLYSSGYYTDGKGAFTPETLSAAYARISRDATPVGELREKACKEVTEARASNQKIVFGYGHASVAEHAVFNFDVVGVSRLAIEALEHSRLCSYTEKSQRYQTLTSGEVHIPEELVGTPQEKTFVELTLQQCQTYADLVREGVPAEDARYVTPLAVRGQLGMTCNARSLEALVRRLVGYPLQEVRDLGIRLHAAAAEVAPSLLKYTTAEPLQAWMSQRGDDSRYAVPGVVFSEDPVKLLHTSLDDAAVSMALRHWQGGYAYGSYSHSPHAIGEFLGLLSSPHDALPRQFELIDFLFEVVVSASCFAQLKRHRMMTLLPQRYVPTLGVTQPSTFPTSKVFGEASRVYREMVDAGVSTFVADYCLTQGHRRRCLVKINARELYAFARLRCDEHAQWDIRALATEMLHQARGRAHDTLAAACGKDSFKKSDV